MSSPAQAGPDSQSPECAEPSEASRLASPGAEASTSSDQGDAVVFKRYRDERDLPVVMNLIDNELSEPYSIFTYRYFVHTWPELCFIACDGERAFGTVVCKMDMHRGVMRGYIAMLVVEKVYRSRGVGSQLVRMAIEAMKREQCEEVVLEAEVTNTGALRLYEQLGFIRDKRLEKYYLNGVDAYRLKLLLPMPDGDLDNHELHPL